MFPVFWNDLSAVTRWVLALLEIVAVVTALAHVILRQRDPRAATFWAVIIIFVPLLGAIFYGMFGVNRLHRAARKFRAVSAWKKAVTQVVPANPWEKTPELPGLQRLASTIGRISRYEFAVGNRIDVYHTGDEAMPAMVTAIRAAQRTVTLSSYIFESKGIGAEFVDALTQATQRGVKVRVLVDGAGTRYSRPSITRVLRSRGVTVAKFVPQHLLIRLLSINLRNHRKILVADGTTGFTGGMNIRPGNMLASNPASPVRDLHFKVEGPVVRQLQRAFAEDWAFCTGEVLQGDEWYPELKPVGDVAVIGVPDGPDEDIEIMPKTIFAAINAASREIRVMTPYFLPDPQIQWALVLAALRGVDVHIITPRNNNIPPVRWASRTIYPALLERGVFISESSGVFDHSKYMTVDSQWALIGSTNWDPRSLRLNFEFNLACFDGKLATELNSHFNKSLKTSEAVTLAELSGASLGSKMLDGIARMFIPVL